MPLRRLFALLLCLAASLAAQAGELRPVPPRPAPALKLADLAGRTHDLADYRGRVVLLNFWATWCVPCRAEMPSLNRLHHKLAGRPFAILAVDLGETDTQVGEFLQKIPVDFPVLMDRDAAAARQWRLQHAPVTHLIDPEGRIRYSVLGAVEWDAPEVVQKIGELMPAGR